MLNMLLCASILLLSDKRINIFYRYDLIWDSLFSWLMNEFQTKIIQETHQYIRQVFKNEGSGHDWWHILRVRNLAVKIAGREGGDLFIIEMAALLHDLDDRKLSGNKKANRAKNWLQQVEAGNEEQKRILQIIDEVSFKGAGVATKATSLESEIVQDADRLDAIGAIGIARTFAYGGSKGRLIFDPDIHPVKHRDFESYKNNRAPTINHFYEKLLLIKERLNTKTALEMAETRHDFMEEFLRRFFSEWENHF